MAHEETVYGALDRPQRRGPLGLRHRLRRAARRRRRRPGRRRARRRWAVLPDARRRRADPGAAADPVGHRLAGLEEEVAVANVALDHLGQARLLLARAGSVGVLGQSRSLARLDPRRGRAGLLRDADEFRCTALVAARRLRADDSPAAGRLHRAARGLRPAAGVARPGARRDRREGRARARLPPRPRRPVAAAHRRRHRGVAPSRAGQRRRGLAAAGRRLHRHGRRTAADRGRRGRRPGHHPRRGARGPDPGARARDAVRAGVAGRRSPARSPRRARPGAGRAARHPAGPGPSAPGGHPGERRDRSRPLGRGRHGHRPCRR